jgi:hypothetical protein
MQCSFSRFTPEGIPANLSSCTSAGGLCFDLEPEIGHKRTGKPFFLAYFINPFDQSYQHYSLSNCCDNNRNVTYMPEPIVMDLGMYITPPEPISAA